MQQSSYVGIDVFKHHLDVAFFGMPNVWRTPNDVSGIAALIRRAAAQEKQREPISSQPLVTGSVEQHLPFLAKQIAAIDETIADAIEVDVMLARRAALLRRWKAAGQTLSLSGRPHHRTLRESVTASRRRAAGKPFARAIVATMRKLLITLSAMVKTTPEYRSA